MNFIPHDYQKYSIDKIIENKKYGLFLDMGLGKTVSTLTAFSDLQLLDTNKMLVIAPLNVAKDTWADEIDKWEHLKHLRVSKVLGSPKQRIAALNKEADIYVTNKENTKWLCDQYKKDWPFDMVVIDELSTFKNPSSQRFKAIRKKQPLIKRFVGLTGTPSPNSLLDLWAQVYLIDRGERLETSFSRYRERFFKPTHQVSDHVFNWELRDGSEEKIYELIEDVCLSMKAGDYLDMPERIDAVQSVNLSSKERKLYDELEKHYILESEEDGTIVAQSGASLSQKLLQLANGAVYTDDESVRHLHDRKLDKLEEIIEESQGQPLLVFYNFKHDKERIMERFDEVVTLDDKGYKDKWNAGKVKILLAHPASAGHGLNLQQGGHIIVWFGLTWSLELYQQANARLYRQGQQHTTIIHHIMTDNTIEQRVYKALQNKELTQDELMKAIKARIEKHK
ncbi:DEAD/DEAH box helicase [Staphylococcus pseudintermedius]|uniref:SNF2-related protein n=1 Tax=Staphylococcus pseudintermedius TaxID=283734 RepID=UPI001032A9AD|nr:DEAD/DEAH box helicase [Staphylococcus pseudintermedius]AZB66519.1 DNA helicase [Staphylococcus phage phiSP15-1]EGQ3068786.1 DEAD/DEAH box helicase [Staphylococcus pseudintermedius]EGQ3567267.1 DEAD/DEAH box helicase [Staphylococcus pseudintermedius]EHD0005643.1 DEAD/DEAH box helicase [Staphylococcus pseudintermedius]EJD5697917.1 DEAD/DEAH box helicase [Staphylococcus pseudintermedius]